MENGSREGDLRKRFGEGHGGDAIESSQDGAIDNGDEGAGCGDKRGAICTSSATPHLY
jgi:hypothetical protein